jgi:hypothetical protein
MPNISNTADLSFGNRATFGLGLLLHTDGIERGRKAIFRLLGRII